MVFWGFLFHFVLFLFFCLYILGCTQGDNCSNQESTPWGDQLAFYQKGHTPEEITKSLL